MNRIGTLMDADAGKYRGDIDSEWLLGHHLLHNEISVSHCCLCVTRKYIVPYPGKVSETCGMILPPSLIFSFRITRSGDYNLG